MENYTTHDNSVTERYNSSSGNKAATTGWRRLSDGAQLRHSQRSNSSSEAKQQHGGRLSTSGTDPNDDDNNQSAARMRLPTSGSNPTDDDNNHSQTLTMELSRLQPITSDSSRTAY